MADINVIKYLYEKKGLNYAQIAREVNHDPRTVKKYILKENWNDYPVKRKKKSSKLEPYKNIIDSWLKEDMNHRRKQRHTAKRIYERLKEEYGDEFNVSYRTVAYYVSKKKKKLYSDDNGYLPLEHYPWEAQVDFGEADFTENGTTYHGYYVNISYPRSNAGYFQIFKGAS